MQSFSGDLSELFLGPGLFTWALNSRLQVFDGTMNETFGKFGSPGKCMNVDFEEVETPGKCEAKRSLIPRPSEFGRTSRGVPLTHDFVG